MFWIVLPYILSALAGGVAVGVLANRRPDLFAKVVKVANSVDASVNSAASAVASKANLSTGPPKA